MAGGLSAVAPARTGREARHALLLAASGDLDRAIPLLQAFQQMHPTSRYALEVAQALARAQGTAKQIAKLDADRAVKEKQRRDDPALASLERGEKLLAKERFAQAAKELMAFRNLRQHPLWGRAWYGLGRAYDGLGQSEKALAAWDDVWRRGSAGTNILMAAESRRAAGDVYLNDLADPARALAAYNDTLRVSPTLDDGAFDLNRGLALLMLGRSADASAVFTARRDRAGEDKIEFLRWDNLVRQCAAGRLAPPPAGILPTQRRAQADLAMADVFLAGGRFERALRHYRHAARPLAGQTGEDRCALGMAQSLTALGRAPEALRIFGHFKEKFGRSPLAPEALLRAGVLSASPRINNFRQARQWFALVANNHPGTDAARAAEFYDATLAWRSCKWTEAEKLYKAFAANHPDSPLAQTISAKILPAIAKKSLNAPMDAGSANGNTIRVCPTDRKRSAFQIEPPEGYSTHLIVVGCLPFKETHIEDVDARGGTTMWLGPNEESESRHNYYLTTAYSSQEYVMIRGTFKENSGDTDGSLPPFRVTVPSVDADWEGFESPTDEVDEPDRHIIVPLNTNSVEDIRYILLWDPYDDDVRNGRPDFPYPAPVSPNITLDWDAKKSFLLLDSKKNAHSQTIHAYGSDFKSKGIDGALRYSLVPVTNPVALLSTRIYTEGQITESGKAIDTIHGRLVLVDLDVDANYDGEIDDDDEPLEMDPGGLVCVCTNNLTKITLKLQPAGLPGKVTLSAEKGGNLIRVWKNTNRTDQVTLPKTWNAGAQPGALYIEGVAASAAVRDVELKLEYDETPQGINSGLFKCEDRVKLTVVKIDMTAYRPQTEGPGYGSPFQRTAVPADQKVSPGAGIRVNGDDDDDNNIPDRDDMTVSSENDLIEVALDAAPPATSDGFSYVLKRNSSNIKVWNSFTKGTALLDANNETNLTFDTSPITVWVENPNGGTADLELQAKTDSGTVVCTDKIHFYPFTSIVIALGGEDQVPTDPANANHGVFGLAIDLYRMGYDVHMYDEDHVDNDDGSGAVYDEIVRAIQQRDISQVAIYGYSHGRGSTHDLAARLDNNRGAIGAFTVPFTAYIDAVESDSFADTDQERRRPPGTVYHVNYYQIGVLNPFSPWLDGGLDGGPIINPPGADFEVNVDAAGQTHTHFTIDDDANVLNGIRTRLAPRVSK